MQVSAASTTGICSSPVRGLRCKVNSWLVHRIERQL
uniref:Uncharacterized protein n=1 Tax=Arundo donax TaxID=35708 RepID=A0A0A8Z5C0_ARUDO